LQGVPASRPGHRHGRCGHSAQTGGRYHHAGVCRGCRRGADRAAFAPNRSVSARQALRGGDLSGSRPAGSGRGHAALRCARLTRFSPAPNAESAGKVLSGLCDQRRDLWNTVMPRGVEQHLVGLPLPHDAAREHVTGEAVYLDDLPPRLDELLVDVIGSSLAHARIRSVDVTAAAQVEGVVGVYTWADVPGENTFGPVFHDEELLAREECHYIGQPIVALAATSRRALEAARAAVRIDLEPLPAVLSIDEAIARRQFIGPTRRIALGNVTAALESAPHVLEGVFHCGGQEHFYLEPQAALAVPG